MNKFSGVLLASDFDATLTDDSGNIPERNIEAIKYFISEGGFFTVSTGRTKEGFHKYDPAIINAPVVVANGAMAYDYKDKRVVFADEINTGSMGFFDDFIKKYPQMCIEFFSVDKGAFVLNPDEITFGHFIGLKFDYNEIKKADKDIFPLVKVMIGARDKTFEVQDYIKDTLPEELMYIPCTGSYVEIMNSSAGKGRGLMKLADYLKVSYKNTYAIGDGANDSDMLQAAETGFAPENADPIALQYADKKVCSNNEGAVAAAIDILDKIYG